MAVASQKKLWRRLAAKLWAGLALLSFAVTGIGIPLPVTDIKDHGIPFPCQGHVCGCPSAEQCWRHCCCFTAAERWAWAKAHYVEPPDYAERPADHDDHESPASCCHHHLSHGPNDVEAKSQSSVRWVLGLSALHCGGPTTSWLSSGALAPPPPPASWSPLRLPIGWVSLADSSCPSVVMGPLDPPPRWSFS
jgi:hypothetical protein